MVIDLHLVVAASNMAGVHRVTSYARNHSSLLHYTP